MPRVTWLNNKDDMLRMIIFGDSIKKTNIYALARALKINPKTLYGWRERPSMIRIGALVEIGRFLKWTDEDWETVTNIIRKR